jgi:predicted nuclease with TOPRIM domain
MGAGGASGFGWRGEGEPERMKIESKNRKKGKTDPELRECLRRLLGESEDLRERFSELRESIPPSVEELAGESILPHPELATEIRVTIEEVLRDHLDPMIEAFIRTAAYEPPRQERGSAVHG